MRQRRWRSLTLRLPPEIIDRLKGIQLPRGLCAAEAFWCWFEEMEKGRPLCKINWKSDEAVPGAYEKTYMRRRGDGSGVRGTVQSSAKSPV